MALEQGGRALLPQKPAAHVPSARPSRAPEVHHLSQREVGAGAIAEAVGERGDPDCVARNLLCLGCLTGPAEQPARALRQRDCTSTSDDKRALLCESRIQVRFVGLAPVEQEVGEQRGLSARMRDAWVVDQPVDARSEVRFATSRFPASASTSTNSGDQVISTPCSLPTSS